MQETTTGNDPSEGAPDDAAASHAGAEPQRRQRERSGMLGEPAGIPPGTDGHSDGTERDDPVHEQVPQDGEDHWRR